MCEKRAVAAGTLTEQEKGSILEAFRPLVLDVEARRRVKRCSLVPVSVVVAACTAYGRCASTVALMKALKQLPRLWQLQLEQEQSRARLEVDLVLDDELAEAEQEDPVHLASELAVMVPFVGDAQDEETVQAVQSWRLRAVPEGLARELDAFTAYRVETLNIHRQGAAVVPVTCENDKATGLRFLGWLSAERDIVPGLGAFARTELAQWASDWVKALAERGVKYSSLSNYTNSLVTLTSFVYNTYRVDDAIHRLATTPLEELVRLRGQCEAEAKQQKLFARADPNYLEWEAANAARAKAEREFRASAGARSTQLLRDWLILALHTIMPRARAPPQAPKRPSASPPLPHPPVPPDVSHPTCGTRRVAPDVWQPTASASSASCAFTPASSPSATASCSTAARSARTRRAGSTGPPSRRCRRCSASPSAATWRSSSTTPSTTSSPTCSTRSATRAAASSRRSGHRWSRRRS